VTNFKVCHAPEQERHFRLDLEGIFLGCQDHRRQGAADRLGTLARRLGKEPLAGCQRSSPGGFPWYMMESAQVWTNEGRSAGNKMDREFLCEAIRLSIEKMKAGEGGPFGAVIVQSRKIVGRGWNGWTDKGVGSVKWVK
jgi:hypothetical protein